MSEGSPAPDVPPPPAPRSPAREGADVEALTAEQRYARALARLAIGRDQEARVDLDAALPVVGDAARLELAYVDLRQGHDLKRVLEAARAVAKRSCEAPALRARALHVMGMAYDRLRRTGRALAVLLEAARLYEQTGNVLARAHVDDSIGLVHATRGRLEAATFYFAVSLVDKAVLGDRRGLAVTIGNLGRVALRAGRFGDAVRCFERDLALAREQGDLRAQARMHEDLGRAWAGLEDDAKAAEAFARAIVLAQRHGHAEIAFFARLDLAALHLRHGRNREARQVLEVAEATAPTGASSYRTGMLQAVRGDLLLAEGDASGLGVLREGVVALERADVLDLEIPARVRLARALLDRGDEAGARTTLLEASRRVRASGYRRFLPLLNEAMASLALVEGAIEEPPRPRSAGGRPADGAYVTLALLGRGQMGEVYQAWDPVRGREVALKVLHLERVYDGARRERLANAARTELLAASRVRHPGVARVFAVGEEDDGGFYVVREYVPGRPLRVAMEAEPDPPFARVGRVALNLAFSLAALHGAGVVHRDLKPENVILRDDGSPVIVDMGVANVDPREADLAGTLAYLAPEQAAGEPVDGRTDLYALGVIVFEWMVGFRPLADGSPDPRAFLDRLRHEAAPRLAEFRPDVAPAVDRFVASLLATDPGDRPANAAEVAHALARLVRTV